MPIAELDNASPSEGEDCGFESRWARQDCHTIILAVVYARHYCNTVSYEKKNHFLSGPFIIYA